MNENIGERLAECEKINSFLIESIKTLTEAFNMQSEDLRVYMQNAPYEILDYRNKNNTLFQPIIKDEYETLEAVLEHKKSLCRFGDGEFASITGNLRAGFTKKYFPEMAASVERILAPAVDAYEKYHEILQYVLRQDKDKLYLIALGPAATVLAYDMAVNGFWAIDIGHLDIEYEWFLKGNGKREKIDNKYNNEYPGGDNPKDIYDEKYLSEIIADFSK